jgi:hypothetical protein
MKCGSWYTAADKSNVLLNTADSEQGTLVMYNDKNGPDNKAKRFHEQLCCCEGGANCMTSHVAKFFVD